MKVERGPQSLLMRPFRVSFLLVPQVRETARALAEEHGCKRPCKRVENPSRVQACVAVIFAHELLLSQVIALSCLCARFAFDV